MRPIVAGNWKMHHGGHDAAEVAAGIVAALGGAAPEAVKVAVLPPLSALAAVTKAVEGSGIVVGAQTCHSEPSGAFTGSVSAEMLSGLGCFYVLAGHSERRRLDGETDDQVHARVGAILRSGMLPIVCVGESLDEREADETADVLRRQVTAALRDIHPDAAKGLVIAYEPVWAIGTGRTATPEQAKDGHALIRSIVGDIWGPEAADRLRVLYGGSVKPGNAADLLAQPGVDGALVGGASLVAADFAAIVNAAVPGGGATAGGDA